MKQLFYVFDEHTDVLKECRKIGLKPCGELSVTKYSFGDTKYILLSPRECYSGFAITLMALPCLSYEELLRVVESSKIEDEILGGLGILLKEYFEKFINYLSKAQTKRAKRIKRIILKYIVNNSPYISEKQLLVNVCTT